MLGLINRLVLVLVLAVAVFPDTILWPHRVKLSMVWLAVYLDYPGRDNAAKMTSLLLSLVCVTGTQ